MKYEITSTKIIRNDIEINTYGIKYGNLVRFDDVSTDKNNIKRLIYNLNKYHTDVTHLYYIIVDFVDSDSNYFII